MKIFDMVTLPFIYVANRCGGDGGGGWPMLSLLDGGSQTKVPGPVVINNAYHNSGPEPGERALLEATYMGCILLWTRSLCKMPRSKPHTYIVERVPPPVAIPLLADAKTLLNYDSTKSVARLDN